MNDCVPVGVCLLCLDGVGGADQLTPVGDGVGLSENHHNHRAAAHVGYETREEELAVMLRVEVTRLLGCHHKTLLLQTNTIIGICSIGFINVLMTTIEYLQII